MYNFWNYINHKPFYVFIKFKISIIILADFRLGSFALNPLPKKSES